MDIVGPTKSVLIIGVHVLISRVAPMDRTWDTQTTNCMVRMYGDALSILDQPEAIRAKWPPVVPVVKNMQEKQAVSENIVSLLRFGNLHTNIPTHTVKISPPAL